MGLFGKYLNSDVPLCPPVGIDLGSWLANDGGDYLVSRPRALFKHDVLIFQVPQNPTFNVDGQAVTFNHSFGSYSTSVIGNISAQWIKQKAAADRPFFAYIATKAPHIQDGDDWPITIPAPWYNKTFPGIAPPRTPNYNFSALDHHQLIASQPPITYEQAIHIDMLYRARWQSLLSVDDVVEGENFLFIFFFFLLAGLQK